MKYIEHNFGLGQTIRAVIREKHDVILSEKDLSCLMIRYNELNHNQVPRIGITVKIPILEK